MVKYDVTKEKGGRWYVYLDNPSKPVPGSYRKDKKDALHIAADYNGIPYKDFLKLRKDKD